MAYRIKESHLSCPYEPTHQILPHRMAQHIIKCRKNYPELDMKVCVFNATHVIPTKDYQAHILECPDKAIVERDIYRRQEVEDAMEIKRKEWITMPAESVWDEDWEKEMVENPYNAKEAIISKEITRPPPPGTMGKSGRRAWRLAEIERVNRIKEGIQICDMDHPDVSISSSMINLGGSSSTFHPRNAERDVIKSSLTASKCNLAMRADQPLRRPKALLQKTRIAANIFSNNLDEDLKASEDTGALQNMSKAAMKNKKKREAARRKRTEEICVEENYENIPDNINTAYASAATNFEMTGVPETDKEIRKLKKKLDAIAKLKISQKGGKSLEKNQLDKIAMEDTLMTELENLTL